MGLSYITHVLGIKVTNYQVYALLLDLDPKHRNKIEKAFDRNIKELIDGDAVGSTGTDWINSQNVFLNFY